MTLAPRRKPLFNRNRRAGRGTRRAALCVALAAALGLAFTVGMNVGAKSGIAGPVKSIIAAYLQ